ncbi:hypothetical protein ACQ4PT_022685 [Festuca glaucescens]
MSSKKQKLDQGLPHSPEPRNGSAPYSTTQSVMDIDVGPVNGASPAAANGADPAAAPVSAGEASLGRHLARRLVQVGVGDVFAVPGDFNLTLLDHLIAEPGLRLVGCCNELNAGYAADGYARARGVGACAVTFTVGGLSVLNAIAGAYSENLPVICIAGGPNSNDYGTNRILHHTIQTVTCHQAVVTNLDDAHEQIDTAVATALRESKPWRQTVQFLNKAVKPVLVGSPKFRVAKAQKAFIDLVNASGYAYATMPSAKGLVPETHPHFVGTYWGTVSTAFCAEIVESADAYIFAGPIFNDYSSVGYSFLLKKDKAIIVQPDRVIVGNGPAFGCVMMKEYLSELAKRHIQKVLTGDNAVIAETGDSWFNCQKLKLPEGCGYEFQMQYGSIGWSVGAFLGYAQGANDKRVIACIGDGSFEVTAQDVSTMLRCG